MTYREMRPTFEDWRDWNVPWILRHRAATHADKVYLEVPHQGVRLTFAETLHRAERIAGGLIADGHQAGERLLIMAPNSIETVLSWFGSALAGMVEVPINTAYSGSFLEHQVRTTRPGAVVVHTSLADRFEAGVEAYATVTHYYVTGEPDEVERVVAGFGREGRTARPFAALDAEPAELPEVRAQDLASVFFTSGTTGLSKGVMMSGAQMTFFADEGVSLTRLTEDDTYMSVGPLFHGNSQFLAVYPSLIVGARCVVRERYSASRWIDQIRECGATVTNFVGVMLDWTWRRPERPDDSDNRLRCVWAVPTAASIAPAFRERFGFETFVENFGLTETSMPILCPYGAERPDGAAGLLVEDWFDVRLVDPETDEEVPVGEVGELVVRARHPWTMCSGYYDMPEKTAEVQRNLWFHTGDGLRRDADGWYYFVDRLKDAIRRRGENISSFEVEQAVIEHEQILEAAAVAVPAASAGGEDEVAVFVVLAAGADLDQDAVGEWCRGRLPAFAHPEVVRIVAELPTTPSGKVVKTELRRLVTEADASPAG
jgi:crotonobetaine/carnitine-CoA ligase